MKNKTDVMLSTYGLSKESSIFHFPMLDNFKDEEGIRVLCGQVLRNYPN